MTEPDQQAGHETVTDTRQYNGHWSGNKVRTADEEENRHQLGYDDDVQQAMMAFQIRKWHQIKQAKAKKKQAGLLYEKKVFNGDPEKKVVKGVCEQINESPETQAMQANQQNTDGKPLQLPVIIFARSRRCAQFMVG